VIAPPPNLAEHALALEIKNQARALGFDLVGIASCEPSRFTGYFRDWLDQGRAGEMKYLADRFDERTDPNVYFPGARSAICVALNYHVPVPDAPPQQTGRIARYALGDDYHDLIKSRLHVLADWIRQAVPGCRTRAAVDTAPILEKDLAVRAGIGWMGKNTCVIHPQVGSWLLLGEILTTLSLPPDQTVGDHCGTCTRCIDACPTQAITAPYQLDARRCISYMTIEHRGEIPASEQAAMGDWLFGCDICQEVCPFNRRSPSTDDPALQSRFPGARLDVNEVLKWDEEDYRARLKGSAMKRVKLPILKRNAQIILNNSACGSPNCV
jgi:epoxyqueuosine reductase